MKKLPKEYRAVTSPFYNVKVYDYWGDCYESVFIMFKPFFRFKPNSKYNIQRIIEERSNWDSIIQNECEPVKWQEVKEEGGFSDYWEIDDGLKGRPDKIENKIKLEKLTDTLEVLYPYGDNFSPFQAEVIQDCLRCLGYSQFWIGTELAELDGTSASEEEQIFDINTESSNLLHNKNIYPADKKILFSSAYDMHYSFICSERKSIEELKDKFQFEGFFCDADTTTWWSREK